MAIQILLAWGIGLFGGHLLIAALGGGFGMVLLPIAFFASLPFLAAALLLASPLHRLVDRFFLPLAVLAVAGAGVYAYLKVVRSRGDGRFPRSRRAPQRRLHRRRLPRRST